MNCHSVQPRCPPTRIIKLGGSLLSWPDWPDALHDWLEKNPGNTDEVVNLLVVGGGQPVERLRKLDATIGLGDSICHTLAIDLMTIQAHYVARVLNLPVAVNPADAFGLAVLDVASINDSQQLADRHGRPLPENWSVTSDSIAVALAHRFGAQETVLLKSTDPPPDPPNWAKSDFADAFFPNAVADWNNVRAENLRQYVPTASDF